MGTQRGKLCRRPPDKSCDSQQRIKPTAVLTQKETGRGLSTQPHFLAPDSGHTWQLQGREPGGAGTRAESTEGE
jgi:hypothetical protein